MNTFDRERAKLKDYTELVMLLDTKILFPNLSGTKGPMNVNGKKSFHVVIKDPEQAQVLANEGWNVKFRPPREEGDIGIYHLEVNVNFDSPSWMRQPIIVAVEGDTGQKNMLTDDTCGMIDHRKILSADVEFRARPWIDGTRRGITAWLTRMIVTLEANDMDRKFAELEYPAEEAPFH